MELTTPTQFIYQAAMKTPTVDVAMGKVVKYEEPSLVSVDDTACWLCGGRTGGQGELISKAIKATFNDSDRARALQSKSVCPGCSFCLNQRPLRNYSTVVDNKGIEHPDRPRMREILISPPDPPFVIIIAVSGQKHLHFKAEIAYCRDNYPVQMEETHLQVNVSELKKILNVIEMLYTVFTKEEIRTGQFSLNRIKQFGLARFQDFAGLIEKYRGTRLFSLAIFVAQKSEEIPAKEPEKTEVRTVCITTSIPKPANTQLQLF